MDNLLPFNLLGLIFGSRLQDEQQPLVSGVDKVKMESQSLVSGVDSLKVELHLLVSGVEKINREYEDSVVTPLFLLSRLGSRGRDPLLLVSIVMPREFP